MKKLLVTAIGAAVAFGATADIGPGENFEALNRGEITVAQLGSYWSEPNDDSKTNQYEIVDSSGEAYAGGTYPFDGTATNALQVKTIFGKPVTFNVNSAKTGEQMGSEFYFDSAVKFTVCEDAPDAAYNDAKIVMWLQETEDGSATNLFVRAGYLSEAAGVITATPSNYVYTLAIPGDFADKYHRVTIKALPDITNGRGVPGFAIWIDGSTGNPRIVRSNAEKWDSSFTYSLTEAAQYLDVSQAGALFPSLVQGTALGKTTITGASFDGTGWVEELKFAATAPFAAAEDYVEPKGSYTIGEDAVQFTTIEQLAAAINGYSGAANTVNVQFAKGFEVDTPFELAYNENIGEVVIDFNGCVITNTSSAYMITNNAEQLTFVDASGKGGIRCTSNAETTGAVLNDEGNLAIEGGNFWGDVQTYGMPMSFEVSGGSFKQDLSTYLVAGKAMQLNDTTGMYDVVDTYTIKFVYGEGLATTATVENVAYNATPVAPAEVEVTGKTFTGWSPTIVPATADAIYVAQYTVNQYTIKFVYGANLEYTNAVSNVTHGDTPAPSAEGATADITGKTFAGWSPTIAAATEDATYVAQYTPINYTITYNLNTAVAAAATNAANAVTQFTVESAAITLLDAGCVGYTFNGWYDNAELTGDPVTTVAAGTVGDVTVYAKWTADAPPITPVEPSKELTPPAGKTPSAYADDINSNPAAYITVPAAATATAETYLSLMKAQVSASDSSKVEIVFDTTAEEYAEVTNQVEAAVAAIPVAAAASAGSGTQSFNLSEGSATPGLWYSVTSGNSLTGMNSHSASVQAGSDGSVTGLQAPAYSTQGFYKIDVSPTQDYK